MHDLGREEFLKQKLDIENMAGVGVAKINAGLAHHRETIEQERLIGLALDGMAFPHIDAVNQAVEHEVVDHHDRRAQSRELQGQVMPDEAGAADEKDSLVGQTLTH